MNRTYSEESTASYQAYISERTQWRSEYAAISLEIRQVKIEFKERQRQGRCFNSSLQSHRQALRHKAAAMIQERWEMKRAAGARRARFMAADEIES